MATRQQPENEELVLYTVAEVARRLGVSDEMVRQMINSGELESEEYTPMERTLIRVTPDALRRHIAAKTRQRRASVIKRVK